MKVNRSTGTTRILSLSPLPPVTDMPSRSRLRRLAAYVLLVWLFGLASGIVNACVLGSELRHAPHAAMHQMGDDGAMADHGTGGHGTHQHQSGQKPPCERLCDAPAARAADKDLGSVLAGFWLAPAPLPSVHVRPAANARESFDPAQSPWHVPVPLPIAYQRLTL
jgi:hypothetical protein